MPKREPRAAPRRSAKANDAPERPSELHVPAPHPAPPLQGARPARVSEPATYNLYEAKTQLSELVDRAAGGEEIVIAKAGTPMARLSPLPPSEKPVLRRPGGWKGKIWVADDFDDPLPPEIQQYFDDPQIFPPDYDDQENPR